MNSNIQDIKIGKIKESPFNPRKTFVKLQELSEDIKRRGVLQAVMVRPRNAGFELIFGARRFRAAKLAGLDSIPAVVREMSDDEALETMIVENSKRDDVHPLEDALGYRALLNHGYEVAVIAEKVGNDESFVYKRLKLLDLIKPAQDAFFEEEINIGHAQLLSRLQPEDQKKALEIVFTDTYGYKRSGNDRQAKTVAGLQQWISQNILLKLSAAPFKISNPELLANTPACTQCPKQTGYNKLLFDDIKGAALCTDPFCYQQKISAHVDRSIQEFTKKGKSIVQITSSYDQRGWKPEDPLPASKYHLIYNKQDRCGSLLKAIYVAGCCWAGKTAEICTDAECEKHGKGLSGHSADSDKWRKDQLRRELDQKRKKIIRKQILLDALMKVRFPINRLELELLAIGAFLGAWNDFKKQVASRYKWERIVRDKYSTNWDAMIRKHLEDFDDAGLMRLVLEISAARQVDGLEHTDQKDRIMELAELKQIDHKLIASSLQAEFKATDKKRRERERKAKKAAKSANPVVEIEEQEQETKFED